MEHMLLVALTSLYTDERETDVRLGVLRVAINVLQRHGAHSGSLSCFSLVHVACCTLTQVVQHSSA